MFYVLNYDFLSGAILAPLSLKMLEEDQFEWEEHGKKICSIHRRRCSDESCLKQRQSNAVTKLSIN